MKVYPEHESFNDLLQRQINNKNSINAINDLYDEIKIEYNSIIVY